VYQVNPKSMKKLADTLGVKQQPDEPANDKPSPQGVPTYDEPPIEAYAQYTLDDIEHSKPFGPSARYHLGAATLARRDCVPTQARGNEKNAQFVVGDLSPIFSGSHAPAWEPNEV
jgi:hypothetical protein